MGLDVSGSAAANGSARPMSAIDEVRIRRAIRQIVSSSRTVDGHAETEYVFDLLGYLVPAAQAIVDDEVARTLAELIGSV